LGDWSCVGVEVCFPGPGPILGSYGVGMQSIHLPLKCKESLQKEEYRSAKITSVLEDPGPEVDTDLTIGHTFEVGLGAEMEKLASCPMSAPQDSFSTTRKPPQNSL
jgi:hypothetical protein